MGTSTLEVLDWQLSLSENKPVLPDHWS